MSAKGLLLICIQAVFLQAALSFAIGSPLYPCEGPTVARVIAANIIMDTSAPEPAGVSVFSDQLFIEGPVLVAGTLPFMGTVALEGIVPATGTSAVAYECGVGNVGMVSDVPIVPGVGLGLAGINMLGRL